MRHFGRKLFCLLLLALVLVVPGCARSATNTPAATLEPAPPSNTVVDVLINDGRFDTFASLLETANLTDLLRGDGPFTIFAPTDEVFAAMPDGSMELLQRDKELLANILRQHIVPATVKKADMSSGCDAFSVVPTLAETYMEFNQPPHLSEVSVDNGIEFMINDLEADNGIIHGIAALLVQPEDEHLWLQSIGRFIRANKMDSLAFYYAIWHAGSTSYMDYRAAQDICIPMGAYWLELFDASPFTVLIPSNKAFATLEETLLGSQIDNHVLMTEIIGYHILQGIVELDETGTYTTLSNDHLLISGHNNSLQVGDVEVNVLHQWEASNGRIYLIDQVLLSPTRNWAALPDNLYQAAQDPRFDTLRHLWSIRDLNDEIQQWGPFTIFAPTDDAFAALPQSILDTLQSGDWGVSTDVLTDLLFYHAAEGYYSLDELAQQETIETWYWGRSLTITKRGEHVFVNDSEIIDTIPASNGIIYVIDKVLDQ